MRKIFKISAAAIASIVVFTSLFYFFKFIAKRESRPAFHKGMCYTSWSKTGYGTVESDQSLEKLKELNVEWVAVLTTWYQDNCFATKISPGTGTPLDKSIKHAIEKAHSLGMKVMLKPHLDVLSAEYGNWRGEIACVTEKDWQVWFKNYKDFMSHYAKIAEETGTEMFCIGTELTTATAAHTDKWREIIDAVRKIYRGDLTYAANWDDEYLHIRFWDDLDYAGIDAYFPLSDKEKPGYDELMQAWEKWVYEITRWQKTINKPVIFPEIGYRSSLGAARKPWEHGPGPGADPQVQKDCYRALVDTFWDKEWFYGLYWWDWGTDVRMGGEFDRGFTPQNKPAQDYIAELYKKEVKK